MIPKIIYYTWINPNPLPKVFNFYIEGWRELMPDYEIRQISLENIVKTPFVNEAIRRENYVVAGHYGRCETIFRTGGIYFDIDIETVKSFDSLLCENFFIGICSPDQINCAVIGSVPGHYFLRDCLDFMDGFDFDDPKYDPSNFPTPVEGGIEVETAPLMFARIALSHGWVKCDTTQRFNDITIFNSQYFYRNNITKDTYAIHHFLGTWLHHEKLL